MQKIIVSACLFQHPPSRRYCVSLWLTCAPKQSLPSLGPRPTPFWSSVCVHNNTQEQKTGLLLPSIVNTKVKQGRPGNKANHSPCLFQHPPTFLSQFICLCMGEPGNRVSPASSELYITIFCNIYTQMNCHASANPPPDISKS